jgi:VanZ family protein
VSAVRRLALWGPVTAYMAAIFLLSAQPRLPDLAPGVSDKHAHAAAYAGLAALACRALAGGPLSALTVRGAAGAWALASGYGLTDEIHQSFVPGRSPEGGDWLADAAGAAAAALGCYAWGIIARSRRLRERPRPS